MDWKQLVASVAPGLATALGGPLAGGVVSVLADKLLGGSTGDPVADEAKLAGMLSGGLTPELRAQVLAAEQALKLAVVQAGLEERRIDAETDRAVIADTQNARGRDVELAKLGRQNNRADVMVAGATLGLLACLCSLVLYRDKIPPEAVGIISTVASIFGLCLRDAFTFEFGSSRSSRDKDVTINDLAKR